MLFLGIDLGTSSVKVSVVDGATQACITSAQYPDVEVEIITPQPGWAEQNPDLWWTHVQAAILKCHAAGSYSPADIAAIGIAYQMHGLVVVDKNQSVVRNAIIWCDGRAIPYGDEAFNAIGQEHCLSHLLNSPGNFTAAKLAWLKANEPQLFEQIDKAMLPGDFIALRLTGEATTTASALSEGVFWDFTRSAVSTEVMEHFGFHEHLLPTIQPLFSAHGGVLPAVAAALHLTPGIPVTYKAGDQLNNAFSLNVLEPGEVAATAGTSGVIYAVTDKLSADPQSRINSFAHVNHTAANPRVGVLMCINGAGILNRWVRDTAGNGKSYADLNSAAAKVPAGADGLSVLPFGNGAERMLGNRLPGGQLHGLDLNKHTTAHLVKAAQEGIAFAFKYGLDIMEESGSAPQVIRAGAANMFLSDVFTTAFVNATGVPVELYKTDGSVGAALGAGVGSGHYKTAEAFSQQKPVRHIAPMADGSEERYQQWKALLQSSLQKSL